MLKFRVPASFESKCPLPLPQSTVRRPRGAAPAHARPPRHPATCGDFFAPDPDSRGAKTTGRLQPTSPTKIFPVQGKFQGRHVLFPKQIKTGFSEKSMPKHVHLPFIFLRCQPVPAGARRCQTVPDFYFSQKLYLTILGRSPKAEGYGHVPLP